MEIALLTIAGVSVIFIVGFLRLWKNPPVVNINFTLPLPDKFIVQHQHLPANAETEKPTEEPIPEDILEYCLGESDSWAQNARKMRARELKRETGSWDAAFRMLQKEDVFE